MGKIFPCVILIRLQQLAERVHSQCVVSSNQSTAGTILQSVNCTINAESKLIHCIFHSLVLKKVFDLVIRDGLFTTITKIGSPPKLKSLIECIHKLTLDQDQDVSV